MKERPITLNGRMVRAILEKRKTQMRRVVKVQPPEGISDIWTCYSDTGNRSKIGKSHWAKYNKNMVPIYEGTEWFRFPYGDQGDRLWVRETYGLLGGHPVYRAGPHSEGIVGYALDDGKWKPSIHMHRWESRLTLEIENIRVERLKDITENDAIKEGITPRKFFCRDGEEREGYAADWSCVGNNSRYSPDGILREEDICLGTARFAFGNIWNAIYEKRGFGWDANPWVWVIEFERVE